MTGTGYTAAGGQDPRGRDPRVLFVALDHTGDGYTVGPESLPGAAVASVRREGPGVVVVELARPWDFAASVATERPALAVEVRALDSRHLRVQRREARAVNQFVPADGPIAFTGYVGEGA